MAILTCFEVFRNKRLYSPFAKPFEYNVYSSYFERQNKFKTDA